MVDELGRATDMDRLLVSSGLSTPIFTLSRTTIFGAVTHILVRKYRQKIVSFIFLGYLGEIESDSQTVWSCICTFVPRSVLPNSKSLFAVVDEIRLLGLSSFWLAQLVLLFRFIDFIVRVIVVRQACNVTRA